MCLRGPLFKLPCSIVRCRSQLEGSSGTDDDTDGSSNQLVQPCRPSRIRDPTNQWHPAVATNSEDFSIACIRVAYSSVSKSFLGPNGRALETNSIYVYLAPRPPLSRGRLADRPEEGSRKSSPLRPLLFTIIDFDSETIICGVECLPSPLSLFIAPDITKGEKVNKFRGTSRGSVSNKWWWWCLGEFCLHLELSNIIYSYQKFAYNK